MGRGTVPAKAGMVEGDLPQAAPHKHFRHIIRRFQHLSRRYPHDGNPLLRQPRVALQISHRPVAPVMGNPVDLDAQLGLGAIEIQHIGPDRMLAAEFYPAG